MDKRTRNVQFSQVENKMQQARRRANEHFVGACDARTKEDYNRHIADMDKAINEISIWRKVRDALV